jgi:hypothetical protein
MVDALQYGGFASRVGLPDIFPSISIQDQNNQNFPYMHDEIFFNLILEYAEKYLEGKLEPFILSNKISSNNDALVKVVVGNSFYNMIQGKDILIKF